METSDAVLHAHADARFRADDDRHSGSEGFEQHQTKGVGSRRKNENVHVGKRICQGLSAKDSGKFAKPKVFPKPFSLDSLADHYEAKVVFPGCDQTLLQFG